MSSLTTLPALLAFLEQARFVFSQCPGSPSPVTITGDSIADYAYYECSTITSVVIASTVTTIGIYTIITIPTVYLLKTKNVNKYIIKTTKIKIIKLPNNIIFCCLFL